MNRKKRKPKLYYDQDSDVLYIVAKEGEEEEFLEVVEGINIELDKNKQVIGVEILNASSFMKPVMKMLQRKAAG
jgi:uncharacterized protein YuzE